MTVPVSRPNIILKLRLSFCKDCLKKLKYWLVYPNSEKLFSIFETTYLTQLNECLISILHNPHLLNNTIMLSNFSSPKYM